MSLAQTQARKNKSRAIELGDRDFADIRKLIKEMTGISMDETKRQLVYRRLIGRLKANDCQDFRSYLEFLSLGDATELEIFTNAVTTNLTSFFRESHHFDFLAKTIVPQVETENASTRRFRIWSAGCSTGEEPYSIAITLREEMAMKSGWDTKILATDLDSNVLEKCRQGVYARKRLEQLSNARIDRWFSPLNTDEKNVLKAKPELRNLITFKQLNLMQQWPMKGPFDVIFCRNVIIYFDKATQKVLMDRYAKLLKDGGYLILGHSESLFNVTDRFELLQKTIYKKKY